MTSVSDQARAGLALCSRRHGTGSPRLRSRAPLARRAVRRPLLHRRHHAPASTAGRSARRARRRTRTFATFRPRPPPKRRDSGRACAAAPKPRPARRRGSARPDVVSRALRLIGEGALDDGASVEALLAGPARRHRPASAAAVPAAPGRDAARRRADAPRAFRQEAARRDRPSPISQVAFAAGFGSVRRFNGQMRRTYTRTPTELRRLARQHAAADPRVLPVPARLPAALRLGRGARVPRARATPGVESVDAVALSAHDRGRRASRRRSTCPTLARGSALALDVRFPDPRALLSIVERVRRMFDLGADPAVIAEHLGADPLLRRPLARIPGIRTPGAWDGFELAVRAILGQQISVRAATTLAGRVAAMFGAPVGSHGARHSTRLFPTPAQLADAPLERAGVMPARAADDPHARAPGGRRVDRVRALRRSRRARRGASRGSRHRRLDRGVHRDARVRRARRVSARRSRAAPRGRRLHARARSTPSRGVAAVARLRRDAALAGAPNDDDSRFTENDACSNLMRMCAAARSR